MNIFFKMAKAELITLEDATFLTLKCDEMGNLHTLLDDLHCEFNIHMNMGNIESWEITSLVYMSRVENEIRAIDKFVPRFSKKFQKFMRPILSDYTSIILSRQ